MARHRLYPPDRPPRWRRWPALVAALFGDRYRLMAPVRRARDTRAIGRREYEWRIVLGDRDGLPLDCYTNPDYR